MINYAVRDKVAMKSSTVTWLKSRDLERSTQVLAVRMYVRTVTQKASTNMFSSLLCGGYINTQITKVSYDIM